MVGYVIVGAWLACGVCALVLFLRNGGEPGGGQRSPLAVDDGSSGGLTSALLIASGPIGLGVMAFAVRDIRAAEALEATEAATRQAQQRAEIQAWMSNLSARARVSEQS